MPHTTPASPQPAVSELLSPAPQADTREAQQSVVQKQEDTSDTAYECDHLAVEEQRGENCARIRDLMAHQRAGK